MKHQLSERIITIERLVDADRDRAAAIAGRVGLGGADNLETEARGGGAPNRIDRGCGEGTRNDAAVVHGAP